MTASTRASYYISAGEPSGDAHAARVARILHERGVRHITGAGGPQMEEVGVQLVDRIDRMSTMGVAEIMHTIPHHVRQFIRTRRVIRGGSCALVVLVDYPGYNLRLAVAAGRCNVPVLYYIAPQLWAWGARRIRTMRRFVTHVACILPFEEEFFARQGVPATFVGHPLLDRPPPPAREVARRHLGLEEDKPVLGLFPASRPNEWARLGPLFLETARRVRNADPTVRVAVANPPGPSIWKPDDEDTVTGASSLVMAAADVVLCKSGTTTLEAATAGKPFCIGYQVHPLTYRVAARFVTCPHIGLANLLLNRRAFPEYVQDDANPENLSRSILELFDRGGATAQRQLEAMTEVRHLMGTPGAARRVSDLAMELAA